MMSTVNVQLQQAQPNNQMNQSNHSCSHNFRNYAKYFYSHIYINFIAIKSSTSCPIMVTILESDLKLINDTSK